METLPTPIDDLTAFIVKRRQELALTQRQVAEATGMNAGTLANIEAGRVKKAPSLGTLEKLAVGLRIDPAVLIKIARGELKELRSSRFSERLNSLILKALDEGIVQNSQDIARAIRMTALRLESLREGLEQPTSYEVAAIAVYFENNLYGSGDHHDALLEDAGYTPGLEVTDFSQVALGDFRVPSNLREPLDEWELAVLHKVKDLDFGSFDPRNRRVLWIYDAPARRRILRHFEALYEEEIQIRKQLGLPTLPN